EFHHAPPDPPAPIKPVLKLSEPSPRPSRAWPLTARLAVAVLVIGLATLFTMSLIAVDKVSARASRASQMASQQQGTINTLSRQLAEVQAKVATPAKVYRPPAIYQHYGICLVRTTDNATGDLANITLVTPV